MNGSIPTVPNSITTQIASLHEKYASTRPTDPRSRAEAQTLATSAKQHFQYEAKGSDIRSARKILNAHARNSKTPNLESQSSNAVSNYLNHLSLVGQELENSKKTSPEAMKSFQDSLTKFEKDLTRFSEVRKQIPTGKTSLGGLLPTSIQGLKNLDAKAVGRMSQDELAVLAANIDLLADPKYSEVRIAMITSPKLSLHAMKFLQGAGGLSPEDKITLDKRVDGIIKAKNAAKLAVTKAETAATAAKTAAEAAKQAKTDKSSDAVAVGKAVAEATKARKEADKAAVEAKRLVEALPSDVKVDAKYRMQALQFQIVQDEISAEAAATKLAATTSALVDANDKLKDVAEQKAKAEADAKARKEASFGYKAKAFFSFIFSPFTRFASWLKGLFTSPAKKA